MTNTLSKYSLWLALVILVIFSAIFYLFPELDIKTSEFFYNSSTGFVWLYTKWPITIRHALYSSIYVLGVLCLATIIIRIIRPRWHKLPDKAAILIILSFGLGPGLLVNSVLKNHWGRPRPTQVTIFKGKQHYQKVWVISNACTSNCSFVCGDSAVAFAFWAFLSFIKRRKYRLAFGSTILLFGLFIGFIRMAEGGHFLSDVLISAPLVYIVIWLVNFGMYKIPYNKELQ